MAFTSIGDLSHTYMMRRHNTETKMNITDLSQQLTTGMKTDLAKAVSHDYSLISGLERALAMTETFQRSIAEARVFTDVAQNSLNVIHQETDNLAGTLLSVSGSGLSANVTTVTADAYQSLEAMLSALNTSAAGRSVFGGQATDTTPVVSADTILDALRPAVAAALTPADVIAAVDAWFADGGDYSATAYQGSADPVAGFLVADGQSVVMDVTADRPEIRDTLKAVVKAALLGDVSFAPGSPETQQVLDNAAEGLLTAQAGIIKLEASVGMSQESIEIASTRAQAQRSALQISRSDLLSADPFDTATALQEATNRLETLYTITSRISRLKLTDFI